ncbi:hypothetical protein SAMN04515618_101628 [Collimonas sp. OK307]|uniref:hypothetical protein n=1 Tax=Collimonas sp. OK307 TaxID=1801620 RepID=UPI0008EC040A|nr:hypothetical protein [Collimonas sp. OK307]SFH67097.1 hypothetical protein SAMN04515618_101628 [Collimonas sp. OK307]
MAQIRKRSPSQYQARVRIKGHPEAVRTFSSNSEAVQWASESEGQLLQGLGGALRDADALTLGKALSRYALEVTPRKKSFSNELRRINAWLRNPLASLPLPAIRGKHLAEYRDIAALIFRRRP